MDHLLSLSHHASGRGASRRVGGGHQHDRCLRSMPHELSDRVLHQATRRVTLAAITITSGFTVRASSTIAGPAAAYQTDLPTGRTPSLRSCAATSPRYSAASLIAATRALLPPSRGRVAGSTARTTTTFAPGWRLTSSTAFGSTVSVDREPSSTTRILMPFNDLLHSPTPPSLTGHRRHRIYIGFPRAV